MFWSTRSVRWRTLGKVFSAGLTRQIARSRYASAPTAWLHANSLALTRYFPGQPAMENDMVNARNPSRRGAQRGGLALSFHDIKKE